MKTLKILQYQWKDLLRGKWVVGYGLIFLLLTDALIRFGGSGPKALLSLTNVMLLFVPLVSLVYGVLFLYQSREFVELLLAQPLDRKSLFWGLYGGVSVPLMAAYVIGAALPLFWQGLAFTDQLGSGILVLGLGAVLTLIFIGLGFALGLRYYDDRIKGLGFALVIWLFLAILYDGLVLTFIYMLGDYPLDKPTLVLTMLNPVDLARIIILLKFDISALMGYTGAVFSRFFGSAMGMSVAGLFVLLWTGVPVWLSLRLFHKKDF